ncbi:MAG: winged helix-turn-helix transcriptional regulator [Betaproteobacteria bacterium]|nr:MAG: winged helix-turn-helix transcriptional regulator [Betaproteobacteria bacterium]TAG48335.1 MAG: winged helix-turn-helix transcriptional regulator [Betaproteobacteria bacterium]
MPPRSAASAHHAASARGLPKASANAKKGVAANSSGGVQSLTRGLSLLEQLAESEGGISLTEISNRVGLAPSTAHRLLNTLADMGFVVQANDSGLWYIGLKTYRVGCAFVSNRDFVGESHAHLRKLMEASGETANLSILDGTHVCFIAQVQCHEVMRMLVRLGSRLPAHASGSGKAILSALPEDELVSLLRELKPQKMTPKTIIDTDQLRLQLATIRARGYSYDDEENAMGLRCVAAPIYDEFAEPLGAISLAGPIARLTDERILKLGPLVAHTARDITEKLGGVIPVEM